MHNEIIFDVETKKLFDDIQGTDPGDLGVSIVSLYDRTLDETFNEIEGEMKSFWEKDFKTMWPIFQKADRIVGFNTLGFDVPALAPYADFPFKKLKHFDMLDKIKENLGRRIGLDALAKETLDTQKTGIGVEAVYLWQKGEKESLKKLKKYCEMDVVITRDLYDFGLKNKFLKFKDKWNTIRKVEVDFSYPKNDSKQIGMF